MTCAASTPLVSFCFYPPSYSYSCFYSCCYYRYHHKYCFCHDYNDNYDYDYDDHGCCHHFTTTTCPHELFRKKLRGSACCLQVLGTRTPLFPAQSYFLTPLAGKEGGGGKTNFPDPSPHPRQLGGPRFGNCRPGFRGNRNHQPICRHKLTAQPGTAILGYIQLFMGSP